MLARVFARRITTQTTRYFSTTPGSIRFSKEHEYIKLIDNETGFVGISDYAQESLGELVFVETPQVGAVFDKDAEFGTVESVKAANSIFAPISFTVLEINEEVVNDASMVNNAAETDGWICKVKLNDAAELDTLMNPEQYKEYTDSL